MVGRLDAASSRQARCSSARRAAGSAPRYSATPRTGTMSKLPLGYEHLVRHDLRHTGLTWMAAAGVPVRVL